MTRFGAMRVCSLLLAATPATAHARGLTPHTAAALLDTVFATAPACQSALDAARLQADRAGHVSGLTYVALFEQGRCHSFRHEGALAWRIRMHWTERQTERVR
jgi:hypothetical protein